MPYMPVLIPPSPLYRKRRQVVDLPALVFAGSKPLERSMPCSKSRPAPALFTITGHHRVRAVRAFQRDNSSASVAADGYRSEGLAWLARFQMVARSGLSDARRVSTRT